MSEGQLLRRRSVQENQEQDIQMPILGVYQAEHLDQIKHETKLKDIYSIFQYPLCSGYENPNLNPIKQCKLELGKKFAEQGSKAENNEISKLDGVYNQTKINDFSASNLLRDKIRMVRDLREQFYEQNGQFILQRDLFSDQLSKLANISFQNNKCLQCFQKNAILSQRNNQKKQRPYQMEVSLGGIWFNKHPLHNQEEKKFEEIRPLLKSWAYRSLHPYLPQIAKQLQYLQKMRQDAEDTAEIDKKLDILNKKYTDEKLYLQTLLKKIIHGNSQLREIRKKTGIQTVPWKLHIKQYNVGERPSYDIGVTPVEISQKVISYNQSDNQIMNQTKRRQIVKEETYFVKIYANDFEVGRSQKFKLQWPTFKVPIYQKFTIMLYTAPATLKVEVIKSGFINQVVDTIYLPVPGVNAKSLTSSQKRYAASSFASNGKDYRKKIKEEKQGEEKPQAQAPSGMLLYRIQWVGQGNKMPIMTPKTAQEQTACTQQTELSQVGSMQELFDLKDPRVPHKNIRQNIQGQIRRGGNALLPFIDVQSARHLLLKMKSVLPEMENVQIPLLEQQIRNRQDLLEIIQNEQQRRNQALQASTLDYFNPLEGFFQNQPQVALKNIRQTLAKIKTLKGMSSGARGANIRYKITEQIISQYIFEQMESPLVIFFKNLFTQKRKLGPDASYRVQAKAKIDEIQINLHIRSAKNIPIREGSFERIKNFQEEGNRFRQQQMMLVNNNNFMDRFNGYGQGFYNQQPNVNMHGNVFFNAMQNQGGRNLQVNYNEHLHLDRVNTFTQLRFKKTTKRSRCFEGPFPEWNQTLFFNYSMKNQQTNAQRIFMNSEKNLKLFVFDMFEQSKPTQAISEARIKKSKFYLGRIDIPFAFLIAVPTVSGLYKLQRPLIEFGYGIKKSGLFDNENQAQEVKTQNPDIHTYINLDLFTQPLVDNIVAYNSDRKFVHGAAIENPLVLQRANDWLDDLNTKRYVRLWLSNVEGKSIFICRYLSDEICPPKLISEAGSGSMIERCARYVSLIACKYNCKLLEGTEQFHLSCDQFLNAKMGQDHGILLCNYFNFIDNAEGRRNYQSLLVICKAFPYGKSIFVLRRDRTTKNCQIWDPFKGECYYYPAKQYQTFCCFIKYEKQAQNAVDRGKDIAPIIEISCLVSKNNVFFNLQDSIKPSGIDFDIQEQKLWKTFLNERTRNQLFKKGNIQSFQHPIHPEFYPELQKLQSDMETQINQYVRQRLQSQRRSHFKPYTFRINPRISNQINRKLLPLCQAFKVDHRVTGSDSLLYNQATRSIYDEAVAKIQQERDRIKNEISHQKNLYGFTLNMVYTTLPEILQKVTDTQIHLDENEDVQFVLAIRCFQYPCHVVSVWIFIGAIQ